MTPNMWTAFLINWLFWSGAAIGAVVFAALLELTNASWSESTRSIAQRLHRFVPLSFAASVALALHAPSEYARAIVALAVVYTAALWFCLAPRTARRARSPATVALLIAYVGGFSVIANDMVMSLDPHWVSTLFPAYTFTANVYGGIAVVAVAALATRGARPLDERQRRDLGIVLVGFALLWMYLVWSQFLVIWYGNLPDEISYVARRTSSQWRGVVVALLILRFALPVTTLVTRWGRRPVPFAMVAALCVVGFWIEYFVLIAPASPAPSAVNAVVTTVVFGAAFCASVVPLHRVT